jgi:formylglycine-generating enzyme required for sulfatase activity
VGAYTGSASPYGTYDQGGNVFEWNEQIADPSYRGVRGGNWFSGASGLAASGPVFFTDPEEEADGIGFRVASPIPEPGTGLLVMAGLAGIAVRRRRPAQAL